MPMSNRAPPPRSGLKSHPSGLTSARKPKSACTMPSSPTALSAISSRARATAGTKRADMASMWNSSRRRAASITRRASAALMVKGCLAQDRLPGDCSFHHGHVLHSSRANVSGRRRRGYATHFVSAHCRYTGPEGKNDAMLVRGRSIPGCI